MTMKQLLGISLALVMLIGSVPFGYSEPLRVQLEQGIDADQLQCGNSNHVLVQRSNGNPACVTFHTGYILLERGWTTYEPIHEQMKTNFEEQQEPLNSLERSPAKNTIEWLKGNSIPLEPLGPISFQSEDKDANLIPKYLPSYYELKLHLKPSNVDASVHSTFWYLPEDVDIDSLVYENDMFKHGAIKMVVIKTSQTPDKINSLVTTTLSSSSMPQYHEKIGDFDAVFKIVSEQQHQVQLFNSDYSIFLANTYLPTSEIEKIIISLGDEE